MVMHGNANSCIGCFWLAWGDKWCAHAIHHGYVTDGPRCNGEGYRFVPEHERSVTLWEAW
jgi:hypothetical protein